MRIPVIAAFLILMAVAGATPARAQVTNLSQDVHDAVDGALSWLDGQSAFNNPSPAGDAAGLVALALLEMRVDASQTAAIRGFAGSTAPDQSRLERVINFILGRAHFVNVVDSWDLMALSVYARTGGDDPRARQRIDAIFDHLANNQTPSGYWCYSSPTCDRMETTLPVVAGLAYAREVFSDPAFADAARLARLDQLTANARAGVAANGTSSGFPGEAGHGETPGAPNTIQDTAAGLLIQLLGGADLNDPDVQRYLRWLHHRYAYTSIDRSVSGGWGNAYFSQYVWSATKAFALIEQSGVRPFAGNLGLADLGTLSPLAEPAFAYRQLSVDPTTASRKFHSLDGGPGYYSNPLEPSRWYFDFAYHLLSAQRSDWRLFAAPSIADRYADQAFFILALQSSVGGRCANGQPPCNQPPDAADDFESTVSGTAVTVPVLANDTDADEADSLSVIALTAPIHGAAIHSGTTVTYTPFSGFAGVDTFSYTVSDTHGDTDTATVTITVNKRTATVTAGGGTRVYGAADPALSTVADGFAIEDLPFITFTTTRSEGNDAGIYSTMAVATGAPVENYDVTYTTGTFTITAAPTATALASHLNPSAPGQAVTLTATVTSPSGSPSGAVAFFDGATLLGTAGLGPSGTAALTTSTLTTGAHAITAVYDATLNYLSSDDGVTQNVVMGSTTTVLVSSANPSPVSTAVTFTATVAAAGTPAHGTPQGTVTFLNGASVLGTSPLDAEGKATWTTTGLAVGSHSITAVYGGSAGASGSTSAMLNQVASCPSPGGVAIPGCPVTSLDAVTQQVQTEPSLKAATKRLLIATLQAADNAATRGLRSAPVLVRVFIAEIQWLKRLRAINLAAADRIIADAQQVLARLS